MAAVDTPSVAEFEEQFLEFYRRYYHDTRVSQLAQKFPNEETSLVIDVDDLLRYDVGLLEEIQDRPEQMLEIAESALRKYDLPGVSFDERASVRLGNLEKFDGDRTFDVGSIPHDKDDLGLANVRGQVKKVAQARGRVVEAVFECQRCGTKVPIPQSGSDLQTPHDCAGCERQGPFEINWQMSERENYQLIRLQRPPEKSVQGQRDDLDVELTGDLVGRIPPGTRVSVAAEFRPVLDDEQSTTFSLEGVANNVETDETDFEDLDFSEYEERIHEIANCKNPVQKVVNSIKPSHMGHETIKEAIALQMFGGVKKEHPDGSSTRGISHILLIGDPGVDKSGMLHYAKQLSPRSIYTSGKAATAAGLTCAAVQSDFGDGGWTLEGGALVQAHKGLCAIDEFDKMDEEDRSGVMEALSEGTISPSKAGITNVTMPAEATVLAAANPKYGRFDQYEDIGDQIELDPALISRFDLIFTMQDEPDSEGDYALAKHLNASARHGQMRAAGERIPDEDAVEVEPEIEEDVMRHYIAYAKQNVTPVLTDEADEAIAQFYQSVRAEGADEDSPVPVTARKIEALQRLAEASARIRLSNTIEERDARRAIGIVEECLQDVGIDPETGEFDADVVETGTSKAERDRTTTLFDVIDDLSSQYEDGAPIDKVMSRMTEEGFNVERVEKSIDNHRRSGDIYEPVDSHIRLAPGAR